MKFFTRWNLLCSTVAKFFLVIVFCLIAVTYSASVFAATITTSGSGNWSSTTPGAPWPGGNIPAAGDDIVIGVGFTLTVDGNRTCNSIGFATGTGGTLTVNSTFQLTVTTGISAPTGALLALGNIDYTISGLGAISCANFSINNIATAVSAGTTRVISTVSNLTVSNNLTLNARSVLNLGLVNNNPVFNLRSGTVTVNGSLTTANGAGANESTFDMVTSAASPTLVLGGPTPFNLDGTGTNTIDLNGTGATVNYSRAGDQPIRATPYTNLSTSGSGVKTAGGAITIAGILNVGTSTTFSGSTFTTTMSSTGWSIVNSGTLNFNGLTIAETPTTQSSSNYSVAGLLTVNASKTMAPTGGTITRTGTAWTTTLTGSATFFNYTIAGTPSTQPSTSFSVAGTLTVNASTTFALTGGTITMSATTSAISNAGTLTFNNLTTNNSSGLAVTGDIAVNGVLDFQNGVITPTTFITIGSSGSITNASSSKYINGKLKMIFSAIGSKTFHIGKGGNYRPVVFQYVTLTGTPSTVSFEQFESQMAGSLPASTNADANRYWEYSQSGGTTFTYKITLDPTGFTPTGTVIQLKKDGGTITSNSITTPNYTNTTNYTSISSPTSIALGSNCSATSAAAGPDQTSAATCGLTTVTLAGNTPTYGTGAWTVVTGSGGSFGSASNPASTFSGTAGTAYTLRWTVTNGNCTAQDDVNITFNPNPTTANSGADQTGASTCGLTTVTLAANAASVGTGAWSIVSGTGGTVTTPTSATSTFSGIAGNTYTLRWTISNSPCTASTDDVVITFNKNPTTPNAGADQTSSATCGLTTVTLAANAASIGTGAWSIISGTGGTVTTPTSATSTFSGAAGTTYTLRWTISNSPCTASTDDVVITFNQNPTTANAGADQTGASTCGSTTVTLAANAASIGTGAWSIVSGTGGTVTTPTSATSTFSGIAGNTYTLRWTISNSPCTASTDDVVIMFNQNPTTANAGADQTSSATCGLTTVTLAANAASIGTGAWSIVSGTGGTVTTPANATSTFSGTAGTTYTLRWTISNSPCTASTDDVVITFNRNPTTANAGADQTSSATCGLTTITLAANAASIGTGAWSIVSGTGGTVTTPASATSTFSGIAGNTYTLRWTISNSPCTASTDDVVITFNQNPVITVQPVSATLCSGQSQTFTVTATGGSLTYQWRKAGVNISGATSSTYNIAAITVGDAGSYDVVVTRNGICSVTSASVTLLVNICFGSAANFALFTTAGAVGNTGTSYITGDIGTNIGAVTSFGAPGSVNGNIYIADATTAQVLTDLQAAYTQLSAAPATNTSHAPAFGSGETLYPGVYTIAAAGSVAGTLTLDAQSNPNAIFIFRIGGAFNTGAATTIILTNGASACNVYWVAEGAVGMGAATTMKGTLIANNAAISMAAGGLLEGRMFSTTGAVAVDQVSVAIPTGCSGTNIWTGAISTNWHTAGNWLTTTVPTITTNITIPTGLTNYPILNSDSGTVKNIIIQINASLTVTGAKLKIAGAISNVGTFNAASGTIEMNGTTAQAIPAATFSGNALANLVINNTTGVTLDGTLNLTAVLSVPAGQLNTGGYLTLISTATQTALIDGNGTGDVLGNVTMQRYLTSGFGYKYFSSPFQAATVNEFSDDLDLGATFPTFYRHDENQPHLGWIIYTSTSGVLHPGEGYAANFGASSSSKTVDVTGVVNNGTISTPTLYNHNQLYTQGFNLVGNPYPSPIDWDAPTGWTRTNIDNAVYYFNAGTTDQYKGTYSSYINGISSNGIAGNIIPSMQGFFVHVSNGSFPVAGQLTFNNSIRTNDLVPDSQIFSRQLLRVSAGFDGEKTSDAAVFYMEDKARKNFDQKYDALKLLNDNVAVPNLYTVTGDAAKVSIRAMTYPRDSVTVQPLGLKTEKDGWINFDTPDIQNIPSGLHIYLFDATTNIYQDLRNNPRYRLFLASGDHKNRFSIVFSFKELNSTPNTIIAELFNVYSSGGKIFVNSKLSAGEKAGLVVYSTNGQVVYKEEFGGNGIHEVPTKLTSAVYIVNIYSGKKMYTKKVFIGN